MGELKKVSEEQTKLITRVRNVGHQVYMANLGLVSKVEEEGRKQFDRLLAAGEKARGEQAAATAKPILAVFGLAELLKEEAEKLKGDGLKTQYEEVKQQLSSLKLREEANKLFDELVAAGEKRKEH